MAKVSVSPRPGRVLLLTGRPGVGKTTVVKKVAAALRRDRLAGFYTEEVRDRGRRRGFRAVTFDGWRTVIADVEHPGPARVGRHGVDVDAVEELAERTLEAPASAAVFLIDEVGKMECHSARFVAGMRRLLALQDHVPPIYNLLSASDLRRWWLSRRSMSPARSRQNTGVRIENVADQAPNRYNARW